MIAKQHMRRLFLRAYLLAATICVWAAPLGK